MLKLLAQKPLLLRKNIIIRFQLLWWTPVADVICIALPQRSILNHNKTRSQFPLLVALTQIGSLWSFFKLYFDIWKPLFDTFKKSYKTSVFAQKTVPNKSPQSYVQEHTRINEENGMSIAPGPTYEGSCGFSARVCFFHRFGPPASIVICLLGSDSISASFVNHKRICVWIAGTVKSKLKCFQFATQSEILS